MNITLCYLSFLPHRLLQCSASPSMLSFSPDGRCSCRTASNEWVWPQRKPWAMEETEAVRQNILSLSPPSANVILTSKFLLTGYLPPAVPSSLSLSSPTQAQSTEHQASLTERLARWRVWHEQTNFLQVLVPRRVMWPSHMASRATNELSILFPGKTKVSVEAEPRGTWRSLEHLSVSSICWPRTFPRVRGERGQSCCSGLNKTMI